MGDALGTEKRGEEIVEKIKKYLIKNSRCKIAWTVREIRYAIKRFK